MEKQSFTKNFRLHLLIPAVIVAVALVLSLCGLGINAGVDFTGGSMLTYKVGEDFDVKDVETALKDAGIADAQIAKTGSGEDTQLEIRAKDLGDASEDRRIALEEELKAKYANLDFVTLETVGATVGRDLIGNAIKSCLIVFVCLLIYIAIRFDLYSGVAALAALLHDILIMCSMMVFARAFYQANTSFIAALLTIIGYSSNNTIIIFDRIRENSRLLTYKGDTHNIIVEASVRQTLSRTINTTITTLITLVMLYILGVDSIREFVFPLIVGMIAGVYSSVMLSGQIWAVWKDRQIFAPLENLFKGRKSSKKAKA